VFPWKSGTFAVGICSETNFERRDLLAGAGKFLIKRYSLEIGIFTLLSRSFNFAQFSESPNQITGMQIFAVVGRSDLRI
jgi:hypothetical protein